MCRLADRMLDEITARAKPAWHAVTIPSATEQFDLNDGCIRVAWGSPDIANLALAVHELGHAVSYRLETKAVVGGRRDDRQSGARALEPDPRGRGCPLPAPGRALGRRLCGLRRRAGAARGDDRSRVLARGQAQHPDPSVAGHPCRRHAGGAPSCRPEQPCRRTAAGWIEERWTQLLGDAGGEATAARGRSERSSSSASSTSSNCLPGSRYDGLARAFALIALDRRRRRVGRPAAGWSTSSTPPGSPATTPNASTSTTAIRARSRRRRADKVAGDV